MSKDLSFKLKEAREGLLFHWCPACDARHPIYLTPNEEGGVWTWDGNAERPTVKPSIMIRRQGLICHYYITDGYVQFCDDSTHMFAGVSVELPDFGRGG